MRYMTLWIDKDDQAAGLKLDNKLSDGWELVNWHPLIETRDGKDVRVEVYLLCKKPGV